MVAQSRHISKNSGYLMVSLTNAKVSKQLDAVSDYFVQKCYAADTTVTNKKIQKLAYYAQAWHLVFNDGKSLFPDKIEAWMHGPAIRTLWYKYKEYGYQNVPNVTKNIEVSPPVKSLIDEIFDVYGHFDAEYLEALTHREDPWIKAREGLMPFDTSSNTISLKSMQDFYGTKLKASTTAAN